MIRWYRCGRHVMDVLSYCRRTMGEGRQVLVEFIGVFFFYWKWGNKEKDLLA